VSASRHALSFKRLHTQQRLSAELGAHSLPQTTHFCGFLKRSDSIARRACSKITSGTMGACDTSASGWGRFRFTLLIYSTPQARACSSQRHIKMYFL